MPDDHDDLDDQDRDDLDALDAWVADSRFDAAATARRRERALTDQASEEASIGGVLRDLGERSAHVVVTTVADRQHRARIRAVGRDFVILSALEGDHAEIVVAMHAIEVLRVPDEAIVTGDRADVLDVGIGEVLTTMAADRPQVHLVTRGGHSLRGELRSTGLDVARVRADTQGHPTAYVPVASIAELVLLG
jgi:hypothetical protein